MEAAGRWCMKSGGWPALVIVFLGLAAMLLAATEIVHWIVVVARALGQDISQREAGHGFALVCVFLAVLLLLYPVSVFISAGHERRTARIRSYFTPDTIARYFERFWGGRPDIVQLLVEWRLSGAARQGNGGLADRNLVVKLEETFHALLFTEFGRGVYLVPAVLMAAIASLVMFFGFAGGIEWSHAVAKSVTAAAGGAPAAQPDVIAIPPTVLGIRMDLASIAAIFGAYTWVVSDAVARNYLGTLHPSDLAWYALRLLVAVPLGETISVMWLPAGTTPAAVNVGAGAFLAFVVSMFSFDTIKQMLSSAAARIGNVPSATPAESPDVIINLPGVGEDTARALATEGIATVAQIISADPVRLSIRSGLAFDFVLGLVDAAILWTFAGASLRSLGPFGFRCASDVVVNAQVLVDADQSVEAAIRFSAAAALRDKAVADDERAQRAAQRACDAKDAAFAAADAVNSAASALLRAPSARTGAGAAAAGLDAAVIQLREALSALAEAVPATTTEAAQNGAEDDPLLVAFDAKAQGINDAFAAMKAPAANPGTPPTSAIASLEMAAKILVDVRTVLPGVSFLVAAAAEGATARQGAITNLNARLATLRVALQDPGETAKVLEDAKIFVRPGFVNVVNAILNDEYAGFIRDLRGRSLPDPFV
jgi:hypothetical protein